MPMDSASAATPSRVDRTSPYSEEAERGVLGSILLDGGRVMDLCTVRGLLPESFHVSSHRVIYEALKEMHDKSLPIDVLTLSERLKSVGRLDVVGGPVFLDRLIDSTPTAAHAEYYIDIVREKHLRRCIIECAVKAEADCYGSDDDVELILGRTEQSFFDITQGQHGTVVSWDQVVKSAVRHVEDIFVTKRGVAGIPTGFRNLDQWLLGMRPGNMIILAARPGVGKTSLAINIVENAVLGREMPDHKPLPVGIFSLEMSKEELVLRMLCTIAEVSSRKIAMGNMNSKEHRNLIQAADALGKAEIFLDDSASLDVTELRARARRMKRKREIQLLVVDYLQLLHCREYMKQGRQVEISAVSGNLKAMAKELRIPVLVVSQLSRAPEAREGKAKLSDLRDSGSIEQDADAVLLLRVAEAEREGAELPDETRLVPMILDLAKHRNGPTWSDIRLLFDRQFTRFRDLAMGVDEPEAPATRTGGE